MPRFIVKPDPAEDFYVFWSTIVDDVIACGSRAELAAQPVEPGGWSGVTRSVLFERADRTGSSSAFGRYDWDVEEFSLGQYSEPRYVKRESLAAYVRALMSDGRDAAIVHTALVSEPAEFRSRFQPPVDAPPAMDGRIPEALHEKLDTGGPRAIRDSGEGDDAAWLDAAPVGTVVRDAEADTWTKSGGPVNGSWFLNGGRGGAGATFVASHGPLTVVSVPEQTTLTIPGDPKMIREALCVAEGATLRNVDKQNLHGAREVLGALIQECDRHRPLGPDGKHGDRHTATCGCDDVSEETA